MATKMKMVMKGGKKVPAFAADGKGKMKMGGVKMKKYDNGGDTPGTGDPAPRLTGFEKRQAKKIAKAKTKSEVAKIEGEGTVADMRNNRARRFSEATGTVRRKVPKSVSTSNSNSTSITKDSGNTYNTTSSGSSSGSSSGAVAGANAGADADANSSSTINPMPRRTPRPINRPRPDVRRGTPIQKRGGSTKAIKPKMKVGGSTTRKMGSGGMYNPAMMSPMKKGGTTLKKAMYGSTMKPTMMKKGGTKKK